VNRFRQFVIRVTYFSELQLLFTIISGLADLNASDRARLQAYRMRKKTGEKEYKCDSNLLGGRISFSETMMFRRRIKKKKMFKIIPKRRTRLRTNIIRLSDHYRYSRCKNYLDGNFPMLFYTSRIRIGFGALVLHITDYGTMCSPCRRSIRTD